jgi:pimeloyl-ACP methyl ester carboxylesterase
MTRPRVLALAAVATAAALVTTLLFVVSGESVADPSSARCNDPAVTFGVPKRLSDHQDVAVRFSCAGATLAGTLALPSGPGPHPAAVWVHASGEAGRLTYSGAPLVRALVDAGVAVLSYDKRGVGASQGRCCPGDSGHFNLLAADADGALHALTTRKDIDPDRLGFIGASQAGWVVPLAVARADRPVRFTALADAPVVSHGQEQLYSRLTGEEGGHPSGLPDDSVLRRVRQEGPSGFQPLPFLREMTGAGLWLYGGRDRSQPTALDLEVLARLHGTGHQFTTRVFSDADHGLLDVPPTDLQALPTLVGWVRQTVSNTALGVEAAGGPAATLAAFRQVQTSTKVVVSLDGDVRSTPGFPHDRG